MPPIALTTDVKRSFTPFNEQLEHDLAEDEKSEVPPPQCRTPGIGICSEQVMAIVSAMPAAITRHAMILGRVTALSHTQSA